METIVVYSIVFGCVAVLLALYFYFAYLRAKKVKARIASEYGEAPNWDLDERDYNSMKQYYQKAPATEACIDDMTWSDLNMDSLFKRIKNTQSSVGDEYAYRFFRRQHNGDLAHFEGTVAAMHKEEGKRQQLQYAFYGIGRKTNNTLIELILNSGKFPKIPFLAVMLLTLLNVGSLVWLGIDVDYGILAVVATFCLAIFLFFYVIKKILQAMESLEMFVRMVKAARQFVKMDIPAFRKETEATKKNLKAFSNINLMADIVVQSSSVGATGSGGSMLTIVIAYFGLYAIAYKLLVHFFTKHQKQILELYETIGYVEFCISVASYRASVDYYCHPSFSEDTQIEFDKIVHPLLKQPVPNTHVIENKIIVTGSNASGKSTFAKTLAVNAILGQLINTCLAQKYVFKPCVVFTSMNLQDDIIAGDSYYVAEVKSLKRLMHEAAKQTYPMLFIDEMFKGTNPVERVASASVILKKLAEEQCFVCLTTHDLELSRILAAYYKNYHFQEQFTDEDICFDYKLREGTTTGSNAIRMLAYCDYSPEIVLQAEHYANRFRQLGKWEAL